MSMTPDEREVMEGMRQRIIELERRLHILGTLVASSCFKLAEQDVRILNYANGVFVAVGSPEQAQKHLDSFKDTFSEIGDLMERAQKTARDG
jgi:DNA-binding cell septation regulator SpoVG